MIKVISTINLRDFEAHSGAKDVLEELIENGHVEDLEEEIEALYPDGIDDTTLNDYIWFQVDDDHPEWFEVEYENEDENEDEEDL